MLETNNTTFATEPLAFLAFKTGGLGAAFGAFAFGGALIWKAASLTSTRSGNRSKYRFNDAALMPSFLATEAKWPVVAKKRF